MKETAGVLNSSATSVLVPAASNEQDTQRRVMKRTAPVFTPTPPGANSEPQSFARSTYDPSSVITTIRVPVVICGGTAVRTPLDNTAGLYDEDAVCPLVTGSVSTTSSVARCGS